MSKTRSAIAAVLSVVLGLLVGLGVGALVWGDKAKPRRADAAKLATVTTRPPVVRGPARLGTGTFSWFIGANGTTASIEGTDIELHLSGVDAQVLGYSNQPIPAVVSVPTEQFFGAGPLAYDFGPDDTHAALVRGTKSRMPITATVVSSVLNGKEVGLTLRLPDVSSAKHARDVLSKKERITVVIVGAPLGPR